jgi:hypothetical protein
MKIKNYLALTICVLSAINSFSQDVETIYRRSSLYTMMIDEPNRLFAKEIKEAFFNMPFP